MLDKTREWNLYELLMTFMDIFLIIYILFNLFMSDDKRS
jgi:hypothetical protein